MRKALMAIILTAVLIAASAAIAQSPDYLPGPVWRMVYYRINPGQEGVFWKNMREDFQPIFELAKKEGVMTEFKIYKNPVKDHPGDWDVMLALGYPNYAALDQLEAKWASWYVKYYGSQAKVSEGVKERDGSREVVAVRLVREVKLK